MTRALPRDYRNLGDVATPRPAWLAVSRAFARHGAILGRVGAQARFRRHGLDARFDGAGPVHDHPRPEPVLRRSGALEERALADDAMLRDLFAGEFTLASLRLFARVRYQRNDRA